MITSLEIAKLLADQKREAKKKNAKTGFDSALIGLGVHLKSKKKR